MKEQAIPALEDAKILVVTYGVERAAGTKNQAMYK
jgi:hypothetical protein